MISKNMNSETPNTNNVTTREEGCIPMFRRIQEKKLGEKIPSTNVSRIHLKMGPIILYNIHTFFVLKTSTQT
jgi:hypothetical protein